MSRRLFFALWPDDDLRRALHDWQCRHLPARASPTHPLDLHMTLHFLGQVEEARLAGLLALGGGLPLPDFELRLDRLGHWARPRVLWVGPSRPPPALMAFHRRLEDALARLGFARDERRYRPHVTLARKVREAPVRLDFPPLTWRVAHWALLESRPGRRPLYHVIGSWGAKKISSQG
jgi:2'-5' RNA ligase